jgi:arylsulfatase A-like enzyme
MKPTPLLALLVTAFLIPRSAFAGAEPAAAHPNILWISSEDHNPHMGCYGDAYATTPNVDKLAARGVIYLHAWSCAPVCAPARTTIISGMYPTSTGSEHMRSLVAFPAGKKMFPQFLREAGYYCTNNSKEDYNLEKPGQVWDDSSNKAHWRNRAAGQPFFAVFNSLKSHESQIRTRPHTQVHDPTKARVPAYHPDTPEVRQDWAQYYDQVSAADADAGRLLDQLEKDGLAGDTIVFYWADHGSGMPGSKRWPYDRGLHVPLVVYFPEKYKQLAPPEYKAGGKSERLVSFVDFAPTMLSLAAIEPPSWMQGRAFAGRFLAPAPPFVFGFRGRMDERYDMVRSVSDGRYVYIRNYLPHLIYGQFIAYQFATPTTRVWKRLFDEGKLNEAQSAFWKPKPPEELYDLQSDRDEVKNLAHSLEHGEILGKLRAALREHTLRIRDAGFLTEAEQHSRAAGGTIYDMAQDAKKYPLEKILSMAAHASSLKPEALPLDEADAARYDRLRAAGQATEHLQAGLRDPDSAVRYWAAMGFLMRDKRAFDTARDKLRALLKDESPSVRIAAAHALAQHGSDADRNAALPVLRELAPPDKNGVYVSMLALNAIDTLGDKAASLRDSLEKMPVKDPKAAERAGTQLPDLVKHILKSE